MSETIAAAKIDRGTQYEDITLSSDILNNHISQIEDKDTRIVSNQEGTIGDADADKSTQCEDISVSLPCSFVLDTIEEETVTTDSISICSSEDPEDAEFRRQEQICLSLCAEPEQEGEHDIEKFHVPTVDCQNKERIVLAPAFENNNNTEELFFINRPKNEAECEDRHLDSDVFGHEDDGCIIDKLDPIEELSEVDSLESFSTHESDLSRHADRSRDSGKVVLEECAEDLCGTSRNSQTRDLSTGVPSELANKELASASIVEYSLDSYQKETGVITEISFEKGPIDETHLCVENESRSLSSVNSCCLDETEISLNTLPFNSSESLTHDTLPLHSSESLTMECEDNVMSPSEARLPPEGAKTEPEMNDADADDTHSVDSLEMIETEKPPWKVIDETSQVSPSVHEVNVAERDDKNECVSQSSSSVADSLDSDQVLLNGSRRSLSSTSDDGGITPIKKESKLPIFIDKHPKFKGSNIPKPRTIRPQPAQISPQSLDSNKETSYISAGACTTNITNEHLNHDVTHNEKPKSRAPSASPKQRRKSLTGGDVIKETATKANLRTRQHTNDLGDMRPTKEPSIEPRETLASRKRIAAIQNINHLEQKETSDDYLTPFQRKEQTIKELKHELKEIQKELAERDIQLQLFDVEKERDLGLLTKEKDDIIDALTKKYERLLESFNELQTSHEDVLRLANDLELKVHSLKEEMTQREARHQEMYLEMYNKGMNSAKFERLDELEKIAKDEPDKVTVKELLEKLKITEAELGYWQSLKRRDIYAESEKPETEAAATLRFLKDSMFHYVTDPKESESHFRAMIQIFGYTPVQMKSIEKIMSGDKKPKKTFTKAKSVERKNSK
ncbi:uncharacterized protein LOC135502914 isoform X2 [Lineus longissimus]